MLMRALPVIIAGAVLSIVTMSDGFLYLAWQRRLDMQVGFFPLLFVVKVAVLSLLTQVPGVPVSVYE